jgi:hypothetical protein
MRIRVAEERGIALVMALGVMMTLTIVTAATVAYTSSNSRATHSSEARSRAVQLAEAGLNEAISVLSSATDKFSPSALPNGSATYPGGSVSWSGSVNFDTWTVTATSTVPSPTGAANIHHTVTTQFRIGKGEEGYAPAWQYVYIDSTSGCTELPQSANVNAPFFAQGDVCLTQSATLTSSEITIKGKITLKNTSAIGSSGTHVQKLHTTGGCSNSDSGHSVANCDSAHRVWVDNKDSVFANISKPTIDLSYSYLTAKPGPQYNCTTGSFPGGFDNDTTMNYSRASVQLLPSTAYSCTVTSGSSTLGKLIWTPGNPGTLQILGVIFFDGDITVSGNAIYSGRGVIYTSGKVTVGNNYLCGAANCDPNAWDGDANLCVWVWAAAPGPVSTAPGCLTTTGGTGFTINGGNAVFQGGVYAVNDIIQQQDSLIEGPMIARKITYGQGTVAQKWPPIDFVGDGAPAPTGQTKLIPVSGTWSG